MMFPAVVYALWGTSRQAGVGPQSIPALLIGSAVSCKLFVSLPSSIVGVEHLCLVSPDQQSR